eukprot:2824738-Pyramimonas_sp.AAC.1
MTLVYYDNAVAPGFPTTNQKVPPLLAFTTSLAPRMHEPFSASKPSAGFDEDLPKFEDLADTPATGGH